MEERKAGADETQLTLSYSIAHPFIHSLTHSLTRCRSSCIISISSPASRPPLLHPLPLSQPLFKDILSLQHPPSSPQPLLLLLTSLLYHDQPHIFSGCCCCYCCCWYLTLQPLQPQSSARSYSASPLTIFSSSIYVRLLRLAASWRAQEYLHPVERYPAIRSSVASKFLPASLHR